MKAIINWIVLIPVLVLAVGAELFTALNPENAQKLLKTDANGVSEIIIFALVGLFALFFILSLFDRKTSPVHILRHNYAAGIFGVIAAFSLAGDTAAKVAEGIRGTGIGTMDFIVLLVSAIASVAMLLVGINHCTATNTKTNLSFLYLSIPLWCAVHLLSRFMSHTATPVTMAETLDLVMYVFLAIFFMYAMMVVSLINGKNPVKAAIYWGAPAAVASLVYMSSLIGDIKASEAPSVFDYLGVVNCGAIGLYIICFIAELTFMSRTKDEQKVLDAVAEDVADEQPQTDDSAENTEETVIDEVVSVDDVGDTQEDEVESEINLNMKKFFDDISSVESEIEPEEAEETETPDEDTDDTARDYGSYFDNEENRDMYIESENIAVDTTKKHHADNTKYPTTHEKTVHEYADRDECIVGLDEVETTPAGYATDGEADGFVISQTHKETAEDNSKAKDNYEARLDEIDRLIISIQGESNQ